jgi:hypothetical protein
MSQPLNLQARVDALDGKVSALQAAFTQAITRLTAVEELLAAGQPRLTFLEEAAKGFTTRVSALEEVSHAPSNADAARIEALETTVAGLADAVNRMGQVVRPGRSVVREQLTDLQVQMAEILKRLPEAAK